MKIRKLNDSQNISVDMSQFGFLIFLVCYKIYNAFIRNPNARKNGKLDFTNISWNSRFYELLYWSMNMIYFRVGEWGFPTNIGGPFSTKFSDSILDSSTDEEKF